MPQRCRVAAPTFTLLTLVSLSGCGGGDDDGGIGTPQLNTAAVQITAHNQVEVTDVALDAVDGSAEAGASLPIGVQGDADSMASRVNVLDFITHEVRRQLRRGKVQVGAIPVGVDFTFSEACEYYNPTTQSWITQGSIGLSGDVADTNSFDTERWSSGDSVTVTFNNCSFDAGESVDGSIAFSINTDFDMAAIDDPVQCPEGCSTSLDVTINNLRLTIGSAGTLSTGGRFVLTWDITPTTLSETLSGSYLYFASSNGDAFSLTNFETTKVLDLAQLGYTYDSSLTVASSEIDGSVQVSASLSGTLSGFSYDTYQANEPDSGSLSITGANSRLTAQVENNTLTLLLDSDGDGTDDESTTITWMQLDAV